ncbi:hypothetical protein C5167_009919 [Papaver somniferum]|uniref:Uncharacterized protein n=1 Tax=Papaver somniferum TaxID=3469 RepID=A0A4Y7JYS3_PAPSO|nr:uncharacterized protein LOC113288481 [Papaver somniferum]RZC66233.1 hypothetical protein C5167_009919 [Papaver somniferum]
MTVDLGDGADANNTLTTTNRIEPEVAGSASASIVLPNEDQLGGEGVLEMVSPNSANKWYTRRSKNSGIKGGRPNDVPICLLNLFNILESHTDGGDATISENLSEISEDVRNATCNPQEQDIEALEIDTGEDSNEESEYETDYDAVDVAKVKKRSLDGK